MHYRPEEPDTMIPETRDDSGHMLANSSLFRSGGRLAMSTWTAIAVGVLVFAGSTASAADFDPEPPPQCTPVWEIEAKKTRTPLTATPDGTTAAVQRRTVTTTVYDCDGEERRVVDYTAWR